MSQPELRLANQRLQHKSEEATLQKVAQEQLQEGAAFASLSPSTNLCSDTKRGGDEMPSSNLAKMPGF